VESAVIEPEVLPPVELADVEPPASVPVVVPSLGGARGAGASMPTDASSIGDCSGTWV
jgi:hypothetical protein